MENFEEKACLCALGKIFGFKPKIALALIEHLGNAREIFKLSRNSLEFLLGPHSQYTDVIRKSAVYESCKELEFYEKHHIDFIGWTDNCYPTLLKECPDAPIGLYIKSITPPQELWSPPKSIAVVGTRDISPYGKEWCERIVQSISSGNERPVIVSGLALGTDICAHKTALDCGLPTIAVMATGPESTYPYRHKDFAWKLWHTPGCALITDYPPGTAPLAVHFLRRNRIIAGLADATILIESKSRGGGMTTSRLAFSYSRDVYALPGRADDVRSQGCNRLIREKVAEPLISIEDLTESLGLGRACRKVRLSPVEILDRHFGKQCPPDQITDFVKILEAIRNERGITVEEAALKTGMEYVKASQITGFLETEGLICVDLLQRCTLETKIFR
jgi:DNA processing protein